MTISERLMYSHSVKYHSSDSSLLQGLGTQEAGKASLSLHLSLVNFRTK